jgi:hypothetical protein
MTIHFATNPIFFNLGPKFTPPSKYHLELLLSGGGEFALLTLLWRSNIQFDPAFETLLI